MRKTRTLSPAQQHRLDLFMARTWESPPMEITMEQLKNQRGSRARMARHDFQSDEKRAKAIASDNYSY